MKNYSSKNVLIAALMVSNMATAAFLTDRKFNLFHRVRTLAGLSAVPVKGATEKPAGHVYAPHGFASNEDELQGCYLAILDRPVDVEEGMIQVHMTIDASGAVNSLELIHSDLTDPDFQSCVLEKIKVARIEPTTERLGVVISHRFNFKKKQLDQLSFEN